MKLSWGKVRRKVGIKMRSRNKQCRRKSGGGSVTMKMKLVRNEVRILNTATDLVLLNVENTYIATWYLMRPIHKANTV